MSAPAPAFTPGQTAADVMLRAPKTLPIDATVREVRAALENPHVQLVLLVDGASFGAAITEIPADADPEAPARTFDSPDVSTMPPETPVEEAFSRTAESPFRRIVVVDKDRALLGLLCLNETLTSFCRRGSSAR